MVMINEEPKGGRGGGGGDDDHDDDDNNGCVSCVYRLFHFRLWPLCIFVFKMVVVSVSVLNHSTDLRESAQVVKAQVIVSASKSDLFPARAIKVSYIKIPLGRNVPMRVLQRVASPQSQLVQKQKEALFRRGRLPRKPVLRVSRPCFAIPPPKTSLRRRTPKSSELPCPITFGSRRLIMAYLELHQCHKQTAPAMWCQILSRLQQRPCSTLATCHFIPSTHTYISIHEKIYYIYIYLYTVLYTHEYTVNTQ